MIDKISLSNFSAFDKLELKFSPGINIIIGENGTGKTQLLKAAYALCSANKKLANPEDSTKDEIARVLTDKLINVFLPLENKLWKLRHLGATEEAGIEADFIGDKKIALTFNTNSQSVAIQENKEYINYSEAPVFIPTKEPLSIMEGFVSLYKKYHLSFDETYDEICSLLDLPLAREERLIEKAKWAIEELEKVIGGKFIFHGGGRITFKSKDNEFSINSIAEGLRKAGALSRLLETGAIEPGVSGPLFWDEPEANMNPKLMRLLVEIMLELARNGLQIILATHDYVLLKWFDLLADKNKGDNINFYALEKNNETNKITISSTDNYLKMRTNPIDETFGELIDQEMDNEMGDLGK